MNEQKKNFRVRRAGVETYFGTSKAALEYWRNALGSVFEYWNGSRWRQGGPRPTAKAE